MEATICQHVPARGYGDRSFLLCPWTNCVEQPAVRFALHRHLAGHVREQIENISV